MKINYKEVVRCYIDEIEIIASGKFYLDTSVSYPGIDLTINAVNMECIGENLVLDTSGASGKEFNHKKAEDGTVVRTTPKPKGDKGVDGYDGDDGLHAGNIIIRVENPIIALDKLKAIKADGGKGG